ncbi:MAG: DUF5908 family protein [Nitrospiria bacterium]
MPVEIRELIIRAVADERSDVSSPSSVSAAPDEEAIIAACVKEVLRILKKEKER